MQSAYRRTFATAKGHLRKVMRSSWPCSRKIRSSRCRVSCTSSSSCRLSAVNCVTTLSCNCRAAKWLSLVCRHECGDVSQLVICMCGSGMSNLFSWGGGDQRAICVKIVISGTPNPLKYCIIFIIHIIHQCGNGPHNTLDYLTPYVYWTVHHLDS